MKSCLHGIRLLALGMAAAFLLAFVLLYTGRLTLVPGSANAIAFFRISVLLPGMGLPLLVLAILRSYQVPAIADAWTCCGALSAAGGLGAVFTALLTMLSAAGELYLYLGVSLFFACLFLYLGGLLCFLSRYLAYRSHL